MKLPFAKMHGAGNDFVVVALAPPAPPADAQLVRSLADRRRGVGADGVLFLERLSSGSDVFRMHFYNSDGGRVSLCLNGARCVALRARQLGWVGSERFSFATEEQSVDAEVEGPSRARADVRLWLRNSPSPPREIDLPAGAVVERGFHVDTGDPHLVLDVGAADLGDDFTERARELRHWTGMLPEGANVHFVHREAPRQWRIRSFERGVEAETQACGSGCLSAVAALAGERSDTISLRTSRGDVLEVRAPAVPGQEWQLHGPAVCSFTAEWTQDEVEGV